jgi:hypothetical protein
MGNLSNVLILMFCLSTVFVLAGISMHNINPTNNNVLYDCDATIMAQYGTCTNNDLNGATPNTDANRVTSNLPTIDSSQTSIVNVVVQTISNVFSSIGTWISQTLGLTYLQSAMSTPKLVLNLAGIPAVYVWAFAGLFIALTVFYFIDWMKGAFA